ncbi:biotin--[acetyl-CoA-carboxylase] ligase [Chryseobacterium aquaticum]|uniref:Biotin--[acetyl-CoA-carboxylase] ligase n=1 Tax=Chryseobacterium aquaticum TaxID=452084 RepID=A0A0Q3HXB8_9FLAO|nr:MULTISPECIES: biotin--[acetyl-CoA-carboxylase] ligase [Chryseobacterium]KQK27237.1 biotin--protein ligase [Chryseobacterium aquaticum]NMR33739.1 biotin--[acetyl-CoA-carboxylase] ligase [Chryseobacterium aquaticum]NRQ45814.1 biotin--[acetyl-CoA-carboxylase] ligase [Chryseobacterium sp. C-204]
MSDLFYQKECSSTNDEISQVLLYPDSNFVGLYTFNQTKGRGQYGNTWISTAEKNLAYTIAVKTDSISLSDFMFNYYTAIAVRQYIAILTENTVKIKWPNDIILANKKVAGILIEKRKYNGENYFLIGTGINILQEKFDKISNAGSIFTQTGKKHDLQTVVKEFHQFLIEKFKNPPSEIEVLDGFNENLFRKDEISVFEIEGVRQNGIIRKADENGKIWIEFENGLQAFYHKEIKLLY